MARHACWECGHARRYKKGEDVIVGLARAVRDFTTCDVGVYGKTDVATGDGFVGDPHWEYECDDFVERGPHRG